MFPSTTSVTAFSLVPAPGAGRRSQVQISPKTFDLIKQEVQVTCTDGHVGNGNPEKVGHRV